MCLSLHCVLMIGVVLTDCYTWSWCAPSRGAFLSGRYAPNTGFEGAGGGGGKAGGKVRVFPTEQPLLPAVLKAASSNYSTLMVVRAIHTQQQHTLYDIQTADRVLCMEDWFILPRPIRTTLRFEC